MALADLVLKARVNVALVRDPRVGVLDIGVRAEDGRVTLTGDADRQEECEAAVAVARHVDGVREVINEMTCGVGARADTAEHVSQRFLDKLDTEWDNLADQNAVSQADYLQWALWMVYKFRLPDHLAAEGAEKVVADTMDEALSRIAGRVNASKAVLALLMMREAQAVADSPHRDAPDAGDAPLVATPVVGGDARAA